MIEDQTPKKENGKGEDMSEYLDTLVSRFWDYQQKVFPIWRDYFDQPKKSNKRPPVFLKNRADYNILLKPEENWGRQ